MCRCVSCVRGKMVGTWLVVLPFLVGFNIVTSQPITKEARRLDASDCCPCPGSVQPSLESKFRGTPSEDCPCLPRVDDAEASASILQPALRAVLPFVRQPDQKAQPKPLLQPEVGLASSVLETLQQATDEEYQEALARDAARSAVKLIESTLDYPDDALIETPKKQVRIFLNTQRDDIGDNLLEPSHIQETRCIHAPLKSIHTNRQLRLRHPTPIVESFDLSHKPTRKVKNMSILHRNYQDMDNKLGASDIQEHVMQPNSDLNLKSINLESNPALLSLFSHQNLEKMEGQKLLNNISDRFSLHQKAKPKMHLKFRELIDNLEVNTKKEKPKTPVIDLKKYISANTRIPPLNLNPELKLLYNNKPLLLKDLLKLKDVELIPPNSLAKNIVVEKSFSPNLKLRSENARKTSFNPDINDCKGHDNNLAPKMSNNIEEMTIKSIPRDITDTETSPTNLNPAFDIKKNEQHEFYENETNNNIKKYIPIECVASSKKNDLTYIISKSIDLGGHPEVNYGQTSLEKDSNKDQETDNCDESTTQYVRQQLLNNNDKHENEELSNTSLQTGEAQNLKDSEDINRDELNNKTFQIELFEDFDVPFEFDNSSFDPNSYIKSNDNIYHNIADIKEIQKLNEPVADTSNNDFQIENQNNLTPDMSEVSLKNMFDDCSSRETFSKNTNIGLDPQISSEINQEINSQEPVFSEGDLSIYSAHDNFSHINKDPNQVSFNDLQHLSNSILRLSECDSLLEKNVNVTNLNEDLDQIYDDYDTSDTAISVPVFETNSKTADAENAPLIKSSLKINGKINQMSVNSNEKLCMSSISDETKQKTEVDDNKSINSNAEDIEMRAEPSELESNFCSPNIPLSSNTVKNIKKSNVFPKATQSLNDSIKRDKNSNFLNNLKSKLEVLFSTTEKIIPSDVLTSLEDNCNESSNTNPVMTKFEKIKNIDTLQRTPMTLLSEIFPGKLAGKSLDSYINKLTVPKYVDQPLTSKSPDILNLPLEMSRLFEEPNLAFTALSDKFRSHAENTIHDMKENLESTLRDSQRFRFSRPTEPIDTDDLFESLTSRHDEMKEKLEAIHVDLNERFSSFQQSILDNFNLLPDRKSEFQEDTINKGLRASYIPKRKELSLLEASKFRNVKNDNNFLPQRTTLTKNGKNAEIISLPIKKFMPSDVTHFRSSNKNLSLQNPVLYSTTTAIPSFIPRSKVLKTNIDSIPRLTSEAVSNTRQSKIPISSNENVTKNKPKSGRPSVLSEEHYTSPSSSSRINIPVKSFKKNTEDINEDDSLIHSPVLRKPLLQRNLNQNSRSEFTKGHQDRGTSNLLEYIGHPSAKQESLLSLIKNGRPKTGSKNNDEPAISATSQVNKIQSSEIEAGFRLVEPMKENVPYKCKLICYKDS